MNLLYVHWMSLSSQPIIWLQFMVIWSIRIETNMNSALSMVVNEETTDLIGFSHTTKSSSSVGENNLVSERRQRGMDRSFKLTGRLESGKYTFFTTMLSQKSIWEHTTSTTITADHKVEFYSGLEQTEAGQMKIGERVSRFASAAYQRVTVWSFKRFISHFLLLRPNMTYLLLCIMYTQI